MQAAAASNLKPVSLELGGKSPFIVFDDVDVDEIAGLALTASTFNKVKLTLKGYFKLGRISFSLIFQRELSERTYSSCFQHFQGEICVAGSRVFVQEGIYDKFVEKVVEKAKAKVVGDPFDPNVQQGPQVYTYHFA